MALEKLRQINYSEKAVETILIDRFKVIPGVSTYEDLATSALVKFSITLSAILSSKLTGRPRKSKTGRADAEEASESYPDVCHNGDFAKDRGNLFGSDTESQDPF
jgi:hypothetical protein